MRIGSGGEARGQRDWGVGEAGDWAVGANAELREVVTELGWAGEQAGHRGEGVGRGGGGRGVTITLRTLTRCMS